MIIKRVDQKKEKSDGEIKYVHIMQPYTMVKDHRTNKQISDVNCT